MYILQGVYEALFLSPIGVLVWISVGFNVWRAYLKPKEKISGQNDFATAIIIWFLPLGFQLVFNPSISESTAALGFVIVSIIAGFWAWVNFRWFKKYRTKLDSAHK